jgi:RNA recognition motif-containing protein
MAKELYVGHLPYETTPDDLRRLFSVAGTVTSVHIITDPATGKSKGCGYVRMAAEEQLKEAIDCLDGALVENMTITVSIANPPKQTKPTGRGTNNTRPGSRRDRARKKQ